MLFVGHLQREAPGTSSWAFRVCQCPGYNTRLQFSIVLGSAAIIEGF